MIRMTDPDLNTLALGTDLTTLGVNLNADVLYATFDSPWSDTPTTIQPQFTLPTCYGIKSSRPKFEHFPEYELGTLFFIFYVMTMDASQAYAAQELNKRKQDLAVVCPRAETGPQRRTRYVAPDISSAFRFEAGLRCARHTLITS